MWFTQTLIYAISLLVLFLVALYLYLKNVFRYWKNEKVEFVEPCFPFGNIKEFIFKRKSIPNILLNIYNHFKSRKVPFGGLYIFHTPVLMILDPTLIKCVLSTNFEHFNYRGNYVDEETDPLTGGLLLLQGHKWKTLRAKLRPTFTSGKMKMMFPTVVACTKQLEIFLDDLIAKHEAIDMKDVLGLLATDIIGSIAFGLDCNSLANKNTEFRNQSNRIFVFNFSDIIKHIIAYSFPKILKTFKVPLTPPETTQFFIKLVKDSVEYRESNKIHRNDFLELLIRLKNNENIADDTSSNIDGTEGISIGCITAQAFAFFAAGFETTSTTLNFCLYELACHPDIQDKLRKEILHVLKNPQMELTYEAIKDMKYMDKVLQETLRKYPPLPMLHRKCTADFKIPGQNYTIKKNTMIVISSLGIHRDPEFYSDPEIFNPERFTNEEKTKWNSFTYLSFGEGPRICIGMQFAIMALKIILATLLKQYKFAVVSKSNDPIDFNVKMLFLSPATPLYLHVTKIEQ